MDRSLKHTFDFDFDMAYRERINGAFHSILSGKPESGLEELRAIEHSFSESSVGGHPDAALHYLLWTQLQIGAAYEELSMLSESREILVRLIRRIPTSHTSDYLPADCFCQESVTARLTLARVDAAKGRFVAARREIEDLIQLIEATHFHGEYRVVKEIYSLHSYCTEFLGYDADPQVVSPTSLLNSVESHWHPAVPLCGDLYAGHQSNYAASWRTFNDVDDDNRILKYEKLGVLLGNIREWLEDCPGATEPRRLVTTYSIWKARVEVEFDLLEDLELSMSDAQANLELLADAEEGVADLLIVTRSLLALAVDVAYHNYANEEVRARYLPISYGCIITSQSLLDAVLEESPVNQAVAIVMSLFFNTASSIYETIGRYSEAVSEMGKCVAVVRELLQKDPSNDRGKRLLALYESALNSSDPEAERYVHNLNWQIERL